MDAAKLLSDMDRRIYTLEQTISNPAVVVPPGGDPVFNSITVGLPGEQVILGVADSSAPQSLALSSGSFYDSIYIDISWAAPLTNPSAVEEYEVEVAKKIAGVYQLGQVARTIGTNFRYEPVEPDTTYGVRVYPINRVGQRGPAAGFLDITTGHDSTIPPAVTGVTAFRGATSVIVKFNGLTAAQAPDVANGAGLYEIQIDTALTFSTGNLRVMRSSATIVAFNDIITEGTWYARVAPIDTSGNQGPWATSGSALAGGVNDSMIIADLNAAKIQFGTMSGSHITTDTLDVNAILNASTLLAKTINIGSGGQFKIGNPSGGFGTSGIYINDQGIRLYKDGTPVVILDAITGSGTFTGNISGSQISGSTIVGGTIQTLPTVPTSGSQGLRFGFAFGGIEFFSGHPSETLPGKMIAFNNGGLPTIRIEGPRLSGGAAPMPYIDLMGGSLNSGNVTITLTGTLNLGIGAASVNIAGSVTTATVIDGVTVYLRSSGSNMEYIDSSGNHIVGNLWMHDRPLYFRGYPDTNHYVLWGAANTVEFGTSAEFRWAVGGAYRMFLGANRLDMNYDYLYVRAGNLRLGEAYGASGMYRPTSGNIAIGCSNGYVIFQSETSMEGLSFYLRTAGDTNHRVYYDSGGDGVRLHGYSYCAIGCLADDAMEAVGLGGQDARSVTVGNTAYIGHLATMHYNMSDPAFKQKMVPLSNFIPKQQGRSAAPLKKMKDHVKEIAPISFEWKKGLPGAGKTWFGFNALDLPPEATYISTLSPGAISEEVTMVSDTALIALLWQGVREMNDELEDAQAQISTLATQVAALTKK